MNAQNRMPARSVLAPPRAARLVLPLALALAATFLLAACTGPPPRGSNGEVEQLRARIERLEQDSASERARLAADTAALRQELRALRLSLDAATRSLGEAGQGAAGRGNADQGDAARSDSANPDGAAGRAGEPGQPEKSPRQALRESLRSMLEACRHGLDRLSQALDRQLARPQKPQPQ